MPDPAHPDPATLHASAVAWERRALLITGSSGAGKSGLALDLMALGCVLVADDRVVLTRAADRVCASPPEALRGLIEARGIGILRAVAAAAPVPVVAEIDLSREEPERLPPDRRTERLGVGLPLLLRPRGPHATAALLQYLKFGRQH